MNYNFAISKSSKREAGITQWPLYFSVQKKGAKVKLMLHTFSSLFSPSDSSPRLNFWPVFFVLFLNTLLKTPRFDRGFHFHLVVFLKVEYYFWQWDMSTCHRPFAKLGDFSSQFQWGVPKSTFFQNQFPTKCFKFKNLSFLGSRILI